MSLLKVTPTEASICNANHTPAKGPHTLASSCLSNKKNSSPITTEHSEARCIANVLLNMKRVLAVLLLWTHLYSEEEWEVVALVIIR